MNFNIFWILGQISAFFALIPLAVALIKYRQLDRVQKRLIGLIALTFITEMIANWVWSKQLNNNPIYHVYAVLEYFLILRIYSTAFNQNKKGYFIVLFTIFAGFAFINTLFFQDLSEFNSNVVTLSAALIVLLALSYFYSLLKQDDLVELIHLPLFWISAGMLIYYSTNFALFFIVQHNTFEFDNRFTIWGLHALINIVLFCFYTRALWVQTTKE